ncbi:DNA invertase Pin-like site-specific DNA recombinase [Saccharopolyspora gloriosae]|uniref:DNA invertase Pin-like site-specific DNA recombinase n=1 Tax=Saccharopolyspora gloriosae TaxID=455344 RepID=A0A840NIN8_9PSEU|nr:DNA invertase Pin-like site-specific DNA recombinase [Saccharopolyspora gloriosae]
MSTEDQQDPESSRNWQRTRAQALIESHGRIAAEYFDVGHSRSLPWKRRTEAARLLHALKDPARGFDAVVIGEPQRAFYGNQYSLTYPVFEHYGVGLWVPEVGGPIDSVSEAHDLIMGVFGGMSKGERNRIKVRVRTAMQSQTEIEGRFLGGRPPYGYRIVDAGPHPNPAKAADGVRLHRLEPDPVTAPVVRRIFAEYLAGVGIYAIAEGLTRDGIACPSAHDRERNRHRSGVAWSKGAVRVILRNPRYTGRQVWNKQRKQESLIDVDDVALGHRTKLAWNPRESWVYSAAPAHEAIVSDETFAQAEEVAATRSAKHPRRAQARVKHRYVLRGLLYCGLCHRRMQGQKSRHQLYYRCRFTQEYALANEIEHPANVYLPEHGILDELDHWIGSALKPPALERTLDALANAHEDDTGQAEVAEAQRVIDDCDGKLAAHRRALEAGADPGLVAGWMREVQTRRAEATARLRRIRHGGQRQLTREEIHQLVARIGDPHELLRNADNDDKADLYGNLGLRLTYHPHNDEVRVEMTLDPDSLGYWRVSEGGLEPPPVGGIPVRGIHLHACEVSIRCAVCV